MNLRIFSRPSSALPQPTPPPHNNTYRRASKNFQPTTAPAPHHRGTRLRLARDIRRRIQHDSRLYFAPLRATAYLACLPTAFTTPTPPTLSRNCLMARCLAAYAGGVIDRLVAWRWRTFASACVSGCWNCSREDIFTRGDYQAPPQLPFYLPTTTGFAHFLTMRTARHILARG